MCAAHVNAFVAQVLAPETLGGSRRKCSQPCQFRFALAPQKSYGLASCVLETRTQNSEKTQISQVPSLQSPLERGGLGGAHLDILEITSLDRMRNTTS